MKNKGFTIIELLLVMGISIILFTVASASLFSARNRNSLNLTVEVLVSDIRQQQLKSMLGFTKNPPTTYNYGIHFENTKYTLFQGLSYNVNDSNNININLDSGIRLNGITLTNSTVTFNKGNGNYINFINGQNTVSMQDTVTGQTTTLTFNRLGVISY